MACGPELGSTGKAVAGCVWRTGCCVEGANCRAGAQLAMDVHVAWGPAWGHRGEVDGAEGAQVLDITQGGGISWKGRGQERNKAWETHVRHQVEEEKRERKLEQEEPARGGKRSERPQTGRARRAWSVQQPASAG